MALSKTITHHFYGVFVLRYDNAVVKVQFGLGTKTTWLGLGKDHGLG